MRLGLTLFSFTREFWLRKWTLEQCLERAGALGDVVALEIVGAQSLPHYPRLTDADRRMFFDAYDRYGLMPTCYGAYVERGRERGKVASLDEAVRLVEDEIAIAGRLGFPLVRLQTATAPILEKLAPIAERAGVRVVVELHAQPIHTPEMQECLALMDRLQTPHLGFILDFGAIMTRLPESYLELGRREGEDVEPVREAWEAGAPVPAGASAWSRMAFSMFGRTSVDSVDDVLPHLAHVHAKFFEIVDGEEPTIPYDALLARLRDGGY